MGMRWLAAGLAGMLAACGAARQPPVVENPYAEDALSYASAGVAAMHRERWDVAEHGFARELASAQLANDIHGIVLAHYNLGMARLAAGRHAEGDAAMQRVLELAQRHGFPVMAARARLAMALDRARRGDLPVAAINVDPGWPADVQLSAGRLALYGHDRAAARRAYARALRRAGNARQGLMLQAEAHLGLAMAARAEHDHASVVSELGHALALCRQVGAPRVAADALVMRASIAEAAADRQDDLERALAIYRNLRDRGGQRRALAALMASATGDARARWQAALHTLGGGEPPPEATH